jgi:hypothetical protein
MADPSTYLVRVLWESPEELADHTRTRFARCWAPVDPFRAGPLRISQFVERPSLGLNGPGVITDLTWVTE